MASVLIYLYSKVYDFTVHAPLGRCVALMREGQVAAPLRIHHGENESPLVPYDVYETHAVHIGTNQKSSDMQRFIDKDRADGSGLHLIDINQTDARIRTVANFLSRYDPERILVVSARQYGQRPARKFAQSIGRKKNRWPFYSWNTNKS